MISIPVYVFVFNLIFSVIGIVFIIYNIFNALDRVLDVRAERLTKKRTRDLENQLAYQKTLVEDYRRAEKERSQTYRTSAVIRN